MSELTMDPIRRPGLAYQHAFDWLAAQLQAATGPVAALAPSSFHAGEFLRRLPDALLLPPLPEGLAGVVTALAADPVNTAPAVSSLAAIAWAEPRAGDLAQIEQVREWLQPGGRLYLLAGGRLDSFLAERRASATPDYLDLGQALALLHQHRFRIQTQIGLHGPRAIAWHTAGQVAGRLGQPARQDRAHFGMRRDFVETGAGRHLSALVLIAAERLP